MFNLSQMSTILAVPSSSVSTSGSPAESPSPSGGQSASSSTAPSVSMSAGVWAFWGQGNLYGDDVVGSIWKMAFRVFVLKEGYRYEGISIFNIKNVFFVFVFQTNEKSVNS